MKSRGLQKLHLLVDALLVALAWLGAYFTRAELSGFFGKNLNPLDSYLKVIPIIALAWLISGAIFGLYQPGRRPGFLEGVQSALKTTLLGLLVLSTFAFFLKEYSFGRTVVVITGAYCLVLQSFSRAFFARAEQRARQSGRDGAATLVLGAGTTGVRLLQKIQDQPGSGYRPVAFLDDDPSLDGEEVAGLPVLGNLEYLREAVQHAAIKEVITAIPELETSKLLSLVVECEDLDVGHHLATDAFAVLTRSQQTDMVGDLPLVRLERREAHLAYAPLKRLLDLLGATALLLFSAPFWLYWVLRIKRDSPGPAIFKQERVGKGGRCFELYKFRTMRREADPFAQAPRAAQDPRVTRYGDWLRRTSIDELPNLINVLKGEMSLVGPRPEMPFIVEDYDDWQRRRLLVKPGISGLWQILGRKDLPMHDNLHYDFYYIHNRSLLLDLSILARTVWAVLARKGAF